MKNFIKKNKVYFIILVIGIFILIVSGFILSTTKTHKELGTYTQAICKKCSHIFHSSSCEKCGSDIVDYGLFKDRSEKYNYDLDTTTKRVAFKDYFSSWEEYSNDYNKALLWSSIFSFTLIAIPVCSLVYHIIRKRKVKKC